MTTYQRTVEATLYGGGGNNVPLPLEVLDASVTLDEGWSPYAQGSVVIKHPGAALLARLSNLVARPRIVLTIISTPGGRRDFDLGIIARQVFVKDGTVGISLASDEAVLQSYAHAGLTNDTGMRWLQFSVRNLVQYVMNRALDTNAIVEPIDQDFTTYSSLRNIWPFPTGLVYTESSRMGFTNVVPGNLTDVGIQLVPRNDDNDSFWFVDPGMQPGKTYTMRGDLRQQAPQTGATFPGRARGISVVVTTAGVPRVLKSSPQKSNTADSQRIGVTFTIPENATESSIRIYNGSSRQPTTAGISWANLSLYEGDGLASDGIYAEPYFDGDTPATAAYTYAWDGERRVSSSTRTPRINRSPETLTWNPGETAWDFLRPILEAAQLRFWCDELRRWHLTPTTYSVPGTITAAAGSNLYSATDLVSRTASQSDGVPLLVDAVIVRYTWVDELGNDRERYDVAAPIGFTKPYLVERPETPYPGAGTASYLLSRYRMRRRQVPVTAAIDLTATPGMAVVLRIGDGTTLRGYLDAVTFDTGSDDMSLATKNLN